MPCSVLFVNLSNMSVEQKEILSACDVSGESAGRKIVRILAASLAICVLTTCGFALFLWVGSTDFGEKWLSNTAAVIVSLLFAVFVAGFTGLCLKDLWKLTNKQMVAVYCFIPAWLIIIAIALVVLFVIGGL
jgi:hypothetical protein